MAGFRLSDGQSIYWAMRNVAAFAVISVEAVEGQDTLGVIGAMAAAPAVHDVLIADHKFAHTKYPLGQIQGVYAPAPAQEILV